MGNLINLTSKASSSASALTVEQQQELEQQFNSDITLMCTTLDDEEYYILAQKYKIDTYALGVRLNLQTKPESLKDFCDNYRSACKYGITAIIESMLNESLRSSCIDHSIPSDYDTFGKHSKKSKQTEYHRTIAQVLRPQGIPVELISLIATYTQSVFTYADLLLTVNKYKESGLVLSCKYHKLSAVQTVMAFINGKLKQVYYSDTSSLNNSCNNAMTWLELKKTVVNQRSNGGTPMHWTLSSFQPLVPTLTTKQTLDDLIMCLFLNSHTVKGDQHGLLGTEQSLSQYIEHMWMRSSYWKEDEALSLNWPFYAKLFDFFNALETQGTFDGSNLSSFIPTDDDDDRKSLAMFLQKYV